MTDRPARRTVEQSENNSSIIRIVDGWPTTADLLKARQRITTICSYDQPRLGSKHGASFRSVRAL